MDIDAIDNWDQKVWYGINSGFIAAHMCIIQHMHWWAEEIIVPWFTESSWLSEFDLISAETNWWTERFIPTTRATLHWWPLIPYYILCRSFCFQLFIVNRRIHFFFNWFVVLLWSTAFLPLPLLVAITNDHLNFPTCMYDGITIIKPMHAIPNCPALISSLSSSTSEESCWMRNWRIVRWSLDAVFKRHLAITTLKFTELMIE